MGLIVEFKKFALRGNMLELAIGFTVGTAFSTVAKSLVDNIIMPPLGLILGRADFSNLFISIKPGDQGRTHFATIKEAAEAHAITLNYGLFINSVVTFMIVALAMFLIIRAVNRLDARLATVFGEKQKEPQAPDNKKCPYCLTTIPYQATRCPACTSALPERAEPVH